MGTKFNPIKLDAIIKNERVKNLVPGTLVYKGKKQEDFRIELIMFDEQEVITKEFTNALSFISFYGEYVADIGKVFWINVSGINKVMEIRSFGEYFDIPDFVLEQILNITKHSMYKVETNVIFSDLQMIYLDSNNIKYENMSIYHKNNAVITFKEKKDDLFESIRDRINNYSGNIRTQNAEYLYSSLLDALVDNYLDVMEKVKYEVDILEECIINEETLSLSSIHSMRKILLYLRLTGDPFEKLVDRLLQKESNQTKNENTVYLENLRDHIRVVNNEVTLQKEVLNALFENYMLNNSNEMNSIMTTLTIFSAVFIPLSFLAGVFGMNFQYMPGLANANGFYVFGISCVIVAGLMIGFFKFRKWF